MSAIEVKMFGASWCMPCQKAKPHFFEVADSYTVADHDIAFSFVDIEAIPLEDVQAYGISSIPVIKVYVDEKYAFDVESRTARMIEMELDTGIFKCLYKDA